MGNQEKPAFLMVQTESVEELEMRLRPKEKPLPSMGLLMFAAKEEKPQGQYITTTRALSKV
jgi:hypothetical protein